MNMREILKSWGYILQTDEWYVEYLFENRRENFFYIDRLPLTVDVSNANKFDQIDMFYQKVLEKKTSKQSFVSLENKYINVIIKLWLYNKVFAESVLLHEADINSIIEKIENQKFATAKNMQKKMPPSCFFEVNKKTDLELLIQIGNRDIADMLFYFNEFQIIIVPSWSCFLLYIHDMSKYQIVKEIVNSEGLFIRHPPNRNGEVN